MKEHKQAERVDIGPSMTLYRGSDGHWISVTASNGKSGAINIEAALHNITRAAFIQWAEDRFAGRSDRP